MFGLRVKYRCGLGGLFIVFELDRNCGVVFVIRLKM